MKSRALGALIVLALTASCGSDTATTAGTIDANTVVSGSPTRSATQLSGSGTIVFNTALAEQKRSFQLTFTLTDGGSLSLLSYSSATGTGGVEMIFARSGTALTVTMKKDATTTSSISQFPATYTDASQAISVVIDVHNDEDPAHILAWSGSTYTEAAAFFNSESHTAAPGQGGGTAWGLTLSNATVTTATSGTAKFTE